MLPDDIFNEEILQYLTLNDLGLHSLIVDYCDNIIDARIISISDAYLSYEYIKMNHSLNTIHSKNDNIYVVLSRLECYLLQITYTTATKAG